MLIDWIDDGSDFGNANGLDYVALDVKIAIAKRFGATVLYGQLPADIPQNPAHANGDAPREPFASFTISHDGGTLSGESRDGNSSTRGYRGHYWLDRIDAETVVFDLRTIPDHRITRYAVRGPMVNASLPAGKVSTLSIPDNLCSVANAYLQGYGGLAATTN